MATNSFELQVAQGQHDLLNDDIRVALFTSAAALDDAVTAYSTTNEVTGTGYTAGGQALTGRTLTTVNGVAVFDCDDVSWPNSTFTTRYALVYNATQANASVRVIDFGADQSPNASEFRITIPTPDDTNGFLRFG